MKGRKYTAYTLTTTILEEAALAAIVLWLLPIWGINIPIWGLILMMLALGAYDYITYRLGKRALDKKPMILSQVIVGNKCTAATLLAPEGYVKVGGELWRASSTGSAIHQGQEAVIVGRDGLTLFVAPLDNGKQERPDTRNPEF